MNNENWIVSKVIVPVCCAVIALYGVTTITNSITNVIRNENTQLTDVEANPVAISNSNAENSANALAESVSTVSVFNNYSASSADMREIIKLSNEAERAYNSGRYVECKNLNFRAALLGDIRAISNFIYLQNIIDEFEYYMHILKYWFSSGHEYYEMFLEIKEAYESDGIYKYDELKKIFESVTEATTFSPDSTKTYYPLMFYEESIFFYETIIHEDSFAATNYIAFMLEKIPMAGEAKGYELTKLLGIIDSELYIGNPDIYQFISAIMQDYVSDNHYEDDASVDADNYIERYLDLSYNEKMDLINSHKMQKHIYFTSKPTGPMYSCTQVGLMYAIVTDCYVFPYELRERYYHSY